MKAKFVENKEVRTHMKPSLGSFALESQPPKDVHWDNCREQFAAKFKEDVDSFFFTVPENKIHDVAEFINRFENVLEISNQTIFAETNKDSVIWICHSKFWSDCLLKRSLFTIILRCGFNYSRNQDNFNDALFGEYKENFYIRETKFAVMRFMFGFTKFIGNYGYVNPNASVLKHGWREEFSKLDEQNIRKRLVLPDESKKELTIVGLESIWF